ncbi:hypothetical protein CN496_08445 [Bacillus cereus]|nr:hypothetical protein CN496_08445 [Bacillus cereus]
MKKQDLYLNTAHCTIKYLNNFIEPDHRYTQRCFFKSAGFLNLRQASHTLNGLKIIHALYKLGSDFFF